MSILLQIGVKFTHRTFSARIISASTLVESQLRLHLNRPPSAWALQQRSFASKRKAIMSDSESENFDVDNVSQASDSDDFEMPAKKVKTRRVLTRLFALLTCLGYVESSCYRLKAQGNKSRHSSKKACSGQGGTQASSSVWDEQKAKGAQEQ